MNQEHVLIDRKILVINDSRERTAAMATAFESAGARVSQAHRDKDAMQFLAWGGYDLIVVHLAKRHPKESRILRFMRKSRPELLGRTTILVDAAMDSKALIRLQVCYLYALFTRFVPEALVDDALRALTFSELKCAA